MSVRFVTGASRGFGVEIVRTALAEGHQVVAAFERIDVLVDNAGHGLLSAVEEATDQDVRAVHVNHAQLGDPAKGAEAIVKIAGAPNAPLRLPLGSDCVRAIEAKLAHVTAELDDWRRLALSTDFA
jgi:NAD(P)-dependent dehydrogenase (short-subunit alcohol dehydrogenase family)